MKPLRDPAFLEAALADSRDGRSTPLDEVRRRYGLRGLGNDEKSFSLEEEEIPALQSIVREAEEGSVVDGFELLEKIGSGRGR